MTARRVLLIEDEVSISSPLAETLRREGFDPTVCESAVGGLAAFRAGGADLVILDIMLPDGDGRDVLREIRAESSVPVMMLTARDDELTKVVGLELGADDYVTKPFGTAELIARIRAVLRRTVQAPRDDAVRMDIGGVSIDKATHTVTVGGEDTHVTPREFDLLFILMSEAGRVVSRGRLMDDVWDPHWWGSTKTLDIHISSLRKKLGDEVAAPRYIHTVRSVGFRFVSAQELETAGGPS